VAYNSSLWLAYVQAHISVAGSQGCSVEILNHVNEINYVKTASVNKTLCKYDKGILASFTPEANTCAFPHVACRLSTHSHMLTREVLAGGGEGNQLLTSVIPATQEAEIRRIAVPGHPRQKVHETTSQPIAGHGGTCLSSQATQEAKIWRTETPGQPGLKSL
jgi:hypothetical protein